MRLTRRLSRFDLIQKTRKIPTLSCSVCRLAKAKVAGSNPVSRSIVSSALSESTFRDEKPDCDKIVINLKFSPFSKGFHFSAILKTASMFVLRLFTSWWAYRMTMERVRHRPRRCTV